MGAKQYWLVDPKLRTFEIWSLDKNKKYQPIATAARGKIRKIPTLPALVVDVDALWAEVDRLEEAFGR
jgi:Uma2 family endonuclease